MTFLPIVARELRVAARRRNTYWGRVGAAGVLIAATSVLLPVFTVQAAAVQGKVLFGILSALAYVYCLLAGAKVTSDTLSSEKREGTIGLLFLTDLKGYDVILGKLVSSSVNAFYSLLAIVPILALALLVGGVTLGEVSGVAVVLLNTLFFSLSCGLFVSVLSRDERKAMYATVGLILLVTFGPILLGWALLMIQQKPLPAGASFVDAFHSYVLLVSPLFAFVFQCTPNALLWRLAPWLFATSVLIIHCLSWTLLGVTSLVVRRVCRERPEGRVRLRWREVWNRWSYGAAENRALFRRELLDRNAFLWLAARDRLKGRSAWLLVGFFMGLWMLGCWGLPNFMADWDVSLSLLALVFVLIKIWLASEVCMRFVADRQCGALELILCTPLGLRSIARGQTLALWRQFGKPVLVLSAFSLWMLWSALHAAGNGLNALDIQGLFLAGLIVFLADLYTLQWVAMHQTLRAASVNRALLATSVRVFVLPWLLFTLLQAGTLLWALLMGSRDDSIGHLAGVWTGVGLLTDLFLVLHARGSFLGHFRDSATHSSSKPPGVAASQRGVDLRSPAPMAKAPPAIRQRQPAQVWAWQYRLLASLGIALLLTAGWFAWQRYSVSRQVKARLAAIRAAREPVTLADFHEWQPAVADEENAATYLTLAQASVVTPGQFPKNKPGFGRLEWPGRSAPLAPEGQAVLPEFMARNQAGLTLIHKGATLKKSHFAIDWGAPWGGPWQLSRLQAEIVALQFEALFYLDQGDAKRALESVDAMLGVGAAAGHEPFIATQFIRLHALRTALDTLERILTLHGIPTADLVSLQGRLQEAELKLPTDLARAWVGERFMGMSSFRASPSQILARWGAPPSGMVAFAWSARQALWSFSGKWDRDFLIYLDDMEQCIRTVRLPIPGNLAPPLNLTVPPGVQAQGPFFSPASLPAWDGVIKQSEMVGRLRAAQTGLAIERFRAKTQRLPEDLGELVPEFLERLPLDPFVSGALRYKTLPQGYTVYSLGHDARDDAGVEEHPLNRGLVNRYYDLPFTVER